MNEDLWELVLIDDKGSEKAHALLLSSKKQAEETANQWNWEKAKFHIGGHWKISRIERMTTQ